MTIDSIISAFVTIIVMFDPPGMAAIFLGLTSGMSRTQRIKTAVRGVSLAMIILIVFAVTGSVILTTLGISLDAFRIAGGILLFVIAFEMIFEKRHERHERSAERAVSDDHVANIAVFPLAIPLTAGPGAISATILLAGTFATPIERLGLISVLVAASLLLLGTLILADRVDKFLGFTGRAILTRLLGVLLAALSVQFVMEGVTQFFA